MKYMNGKLVVYDGTCPLCVRLKVLATSLGIVTEGQCRAYGELSAELKDKVDFQRFRNEMALIDLQGGKTLYGAEGLLTIFNARFSWLFPSGRVVGPGKLVQALYTLLAQNRYVLATPRFDLARCDCKPPLHLPARLFFLALSALAALTLTGLLGLGMQGYFPHTDAVRLAGGSIVLCGSGWLLQSGIALWRFQPQALEYLGHLASVMLRGLLFLLPAILAAAFVSALPLLFPAVCVVASFSFMAYQHWLRVRSLEQSQWWTHLWAFNLLVPALLLYFFARDWLLAL